MSKKPSQQSATQGDQSISQMTSMQPPGAIFVPSNPGVSLMNIPRPCCCCWWFWWYWWPWWPWWWRWNCCKLWQWNKFPVTTTATGSTDPTELQQLVILLATDSTQSLQQFLSEVNGATLQQIKALAEERFPEQFEAAVQFVTNDDITVAENIIAETHSKLDDLAFLKIKALVQENINPCTTAVGTQTGVVSTLFTYPFWWLCWWPWFLVIQFDLRTTEQLRSALMQSSFNDIQALILKYAGPFVNDVEASPFNWQLDDFSWWPFDTTGVATIQENVDLFQSNIGIVKNIIAETACERKAANLPPIGTDWFMQNWPLIVVASDTTVTKLSDISAAVSKLSIENIQTIIDTSMTKVGTAIPAPDNEGLTIKAFPWWWWWMYCRLKWWWWWFWPAAVRNTAGLPTTTLTAMAALSDI